MRSKFPEAHAQGTTSRGVSDPPAPTGQMPAIIFGTETLTSEFASVRLALPVTMLASSAITSSESSNETLLPVTTQARGMIIKPGNRNILTSIATPEWHVSDYLASFATSASSDNRVATSAPVSYSFISAEDASVFSRSSTSFGSSGSVRGSNIATTSPARLTRYFWKFHCTSPATALSGCVVR